MQETFGKYRLIERLAIGGMAEVFVAAVHGEAGFSKPVVIKRLHPRLSEDQEFSQMMIDEARITAQLQHGNIGQVLDLGQVDGSYFIAMEHIAGEDLRTFQDYYRRKKTYMPVEAAVHIVAETLAGLDYAHRQEDIDGEPLGVIHRDVSPQNILISYEGEVKIIDFGIAKAKQRLVHTQVGVIKGKFRYMSPEQASGVDIDHRTDVFASGVVLYELLRGEPHSLRVADTEVLRRMRDADFEPIARSEAEVPDELLHIISRALQRNPRKRYATAGEFRQALVDFMPKIRGERGHGTFTRTDLGALMKSVFPVERRKKRSGISQAKRTTDLERGRVQEGGHPSGLPSTRAEGEGRHVSDSAGLAAKVPAAAEAEFTPLPRESTTPISTAEDFVLQRSAAHQQPANQVPQDAVSGEVNSVNPQDAKAQNALDHTWSRHEVDATVATNQRLTNNVSQPEPARPKRQPRSKRAAAGAFSLGNAQAEPLAQDAAVNAMSSGGSHHAGSQQPAAPNHQQILQNGTEGIGVSTAPDTTRLSDKSLAQFVPSDAQTKRGSKRMLWTVIGAVLLVGLAFGAGRIFSGEGNIRLPGFLRHFGGSQHDTGDNKRSSDDAWDTGDVGGELHIESDPPGAQITLCDDDTQQKTPAVLLLEGGKTCRLQLSLRGYAPFLKTVTGDSNAAVQVRAKLRERSHTLGQKARRNRDRETDVADLLLESAQQGRKKGAGTLVVTSIRVGLVYINKQVVGETPKVKLELPPGEYSVWMDYTTLGVQTGPRTVRIQSGRTVRLHFDPTM